MVFSAVKCPLFTIRSIPNTQEWRPKQIFHPRLKLIYKAHILIKTKWQHLCHTWIINLSYGWKSVSFIGCYLEKYPMKLSHFVCFDLEVVLCFCGNVVTKRTTWLSHSQRKQNHVIAISCFMSTNVMTRLNVCFHNNIRFVWIQF